MLVSAVVPTYNRAHMIVRTLESIQNQTHRDMETIVVDDGSTDDTEQVVKEFAEGSHILVRYYKKPNGGCASARNMGIRLAEGEFVGLLDSDDQWLPDAVESLMNALANSEADFVYSPTVDVMRSGDRVLVKPAAAGHPEMFAWEHFFTANARVCSILYKRFVLNNISFDESLKHNEDSDMLQRVAIKFKAAYCPVPTALIFYHSDNKSGNRVGIYRALLKSTENILNEFPEFSSSLGYLRHRRVDEIRSHLAEALVIAGDYDQAREVAAATGSEFRRPMWLALRFGTSAPVLYEKKITGALSSVRRLIMSRIYRTLVRGVK